MRQTLDQSIMKTSFRLQASEFDCVPTTFLNAISYLFERNEIPPVVVQRIFLYCLDCFSNKKDFSHGTSGAAVRLLSEWLSEYSYKSFSLDAEVITGGKVHLGPGNKITQCINSGGVTLFSVKHYGNHWHYILAISVEDGWLYFFDPYPKSVRSKKSGKYEFIPAATGQQPNLRIKYDWLDTQSNKFPFQLGSRSMRECVLLKRIRTRSAAEA